LLIPSDVIDAEILFVKLLLGDEASAAVVVVVVAPVAVDAGEERSPTDEFSLA
jgi:hypothetical protein